MNMNEVGFFASAVISLQKQGRYLDADNAVKLALAFIHGELTKKQVLTLLELVGSTDAAMLNVLIANVVNRNKSGLNEEYNCDPDVAKKCQRIAK